MHIGLTLPDFAAAPVGGWPKVRDAAVLADGLGFESLWLADGRSDPLVTLGALARTTSRARLGAVFAAARRPPPVLAKALATVDVVSAGRLVAGLEAGSDRPDLVSETTQVLVGMFGGGPFSFTGAHVHVHAAHCLPLPVQRPHPPIWIYGGGEAVLDIVARSTDGWIAPSASSPDDYRRRLADLDAACDRAGRDPATVTRSLRLAAPAGTEADVAEQLAEWESLGMDTVVVEPAAEPGSTAWRDDVAMLASACSLEVS